MFRALDPEVVDARLGRGEAAAAALPIAMSTRWAATARAPQTGTASRASWSAW